MEFDFNKKKVLIMGLGLHGGGVGTVKFFAHRGAHITVTDLRKKEQLLPSLKKLSMLRDVTYILGTHRMDDFLSADLIIKNPGVPPSSPYLIAARKKKIPITTDIGIFFRACSAPIVGITGTRGKSTTAFLISRFLEEFFKKNHNTQKRNVFLGGNIRTSVFDFVDRLGPHDIVILELSSFQLDDLLHDSWHAYPREHKSPHIAVLTNILRDHLNWHNTMRSYIAAKSAIFKFQKKNDVLFINGHDPVVKKITTNVASRVIAPKLPTGWEKIIDKKLGRHYRTSVALAIAVSRHFGIPLSLIKSVLQKFNGLPGRQEYLRAIHGIFVINDTTATVPDACIAAIDHFRIIAKKKNLILIAGGQDKKLLFASMVQAMRQHVDVLILLPGTATEKIKTLLKKEKKSVRPTIIKEVDSMDEAVKIAFEIACQGDYIVLSPGATSFGLFANEFDRGDAFVRALAHYR